MNSEQPNYSWDDSGFQFKKFLFITGVHKYKTLPGRLKNFMPFRMGFDFRTGVIAQKIYLDLRNQLKLSHQFGSMASTPLGEGNMNTSLVSKIISLIQ